MAEKRHIYEGGEKRELPHVEEFLADILAVCRKHKLTLGHEDTHGAFIVEAFATDADAKWLMDAFVSASAAERRL